MWLRFAGRSVLMVVAVALMVAGLGFAGSSSAAAQSVADVEVRDRLIADQEALLNTYRCMFGVDTQVVPGGCSNGAPALPAEDPAPFPGNPTAKDIEIRDKLVADQEALLNVYRCRFNIDTRIVPGGCSDQEVAIPDPTSEEGVEGWIVVPWDEDFLEAAITLSNFLETCGWDQSTRQCDSPEDTEVLYQLLANHHRCAIDRDTSGCVGLDGRNQAAWDSRLACPEGYSIEYYPRVCYHPDHPLHVDYRY